jgi:hypothetical protein
MEESSIYRGKKLNRENISPSSHRKFELQKFELWKKHNMESIGVFSGNMNSFRVMENSSYRRSSYRSSTVVKEIKDGLGLLKTCTIINIAVSKII